MSHREVVGVAIVSALGAAGFLTSIQDREPRIGQIDTPCARLVVEIADTPAARTAGLANREELRGINGVLLKWDEPGRHPI